MLIYRSKLISLATPNKYYFSYDSNSNNENGLEQELGNNHLEELPAQQEEFENQSNIPTKTIDSSDGSDLLSSNANEVYNQAQSFLEFTTIQGSASRDIKSFYLTLESIEDFKRLAEILQFFRDRSTLLFNSHEIYHQEEVQAQSFLKVSSIQGERLAEILQILQFFMDGGLI